MKALSVETAGDVGIVGYAGREMVQALSEVLQGRAVNRREQLAAHGMFFPFLSLMPKLGHRRSWQT